MNRQDEWETPHWLFRLLDEEFHFQIDLAATKANAKCKRFYTREQDALRQTWDPGPAFVNPPYSCIHPWLEAAASAARSGMRVVALIPCRSDTDWWHRGVMQAAEIRFIQGRIGFRLPGYVGRSRAPFSCCVAIFRKGWRGPRPLLGKTIVSQDAPRLRRHEIVTRTPSRDGPSHGTGTRQDVRRPVHPSKERRSESTDSMSACPGLHPFSSTRHRLEIARAATTTQECCVLVRTPDSRRAGNQDAVAYRRQTGRVRLDP